MGQNAEEKLLFIFNMLRDDSITLRHKFALCKSQFASRIAICGKLYLYARFGVVNESISQSKMVPRSAETKIGRSIAARSTAQCLNSTGAYAMVVLSIMVQTRASVYSFGSSIIFKRDRPLNRSATSAV